MSRFSVPDMHCAHCMATIKDALLEADGGMELTFDMEARQVEIDTVLASPEVIATMKNAGYAASEIG